MEVTALIKAVNRRRRRAAAFFLAFKSLASVSEASGRVKYVPGLSCL